MAPIDRGEAFRSTFGRRAREGARESARGTRPSLAARARRPAPVPSTGRRSRDRATLSRPSRLRPRRASESMKKSWIGKVKKMVPSTTFFFGSAAACDNRTAADAAEAGPAIETTPLREIPRGNADPGSRPPRGVRPPVWDSGLRARALPPSELKPSSSAVPACRVGQSQPSEETTVEARCGFREPPVPRANAR